MEYSSVEILVNQLREELRNARKSRDVIAMQTLQSLLARIDNAEAIPVITNTEGGGEFFAGAKSGIGSTEAERKILSMEDILALVDDEITELQNTINELPGQTERTYVENLEKKIEILKSISRRRT
jgi:hypothetical protein